MVLGAVNYRDGCVQRRGTCSWRRGSCDRVYLTSVSGVFDAFVMGGSVLFWLGYVIG